mmetsp:Transcript_76254/g.246938  ORF Transcript_76254/g.246938 Transcript_76254/m.246938 type:complete len:288 (-) Transcript_76254:197-1060(-)
MHVAQQGQRAGVVPARRQPEVVLRLVVVLLEALDAEEVALANCCGHGGVATRGNLHEEVHLGGTDDLAVSLVQVEAHELHGLRHALAVDARDALRHVDVVQGRRGAGLRHAVAVQVPVAHGHERPRVAGRGGRVEVQHRQGLALPEVFARHLQGREEHAEVVLCVGVARVRSALEERRGLREAPDLALHEELRLELVRRQDGHHRQHLPPVHVHELLRCVELPVVAEHGVADVAARLRQQAPEPHHLAQEGGRANVACDEVRVVQDLVRGEALHEHPQVIARQLLPG